MSYRNAQHLQSGELPKRRQPAETPEQPDLSGVEHFMLRAPQNGAELGIEERMARRQGF